MDLKIEGIDKLLSEFNPKVVRRAISSGVNKTAKQTITAISSAVRTEYNIKANRLNAGMKISSRATASNPVAVIEAKGPRPGLQHYSARQIGKSKWKGRRGKKIRAVGGGTKVKVRHAGGRKLIKHAFIVKKGLPTGGTGVFWREGGPRVPSKGRYAGTKTKRQPLIRLTGPSVPQMVKKVGVKTAEKIVNDKLGKIIGYELEFYMGRARR